MDSCYRRKELVFDVVYAWLLLEATEYKASFISVNLTICCEFLSKYPFSIYCSAAWWEIYQNPKCRYRSRTGMNSSAAATNHFYFPGPFMACSKFTGSRIELAAISTCAKGVCTGSVVCDIMVGMSCHRLWSGF